MLLVDLGGHFLPLDTIADNESTTPKVEGCRN